MDSFLLASRRPLLALLVFLVLEGVTGAGFSLDVGLLVSNLLVIPVSLAIFRRGAQGAELSVGAVGRGVWSHLSALLACVAGVVAFNLMADLMRLPDMLEDAFMHLFRIPLGILAVAVVGPVAEELLFRWGIMGHYMRSMSPWMAVAVSSLLFGAIHLNPAQVPFAAAMGVLLGILYWKSGSIVWPIVLHVLNNSLACVQVVWMGDEARDFSLVSHVGGGGSAFVLILTLTAVCGGILYKTYFDENI